eukprot:gene15581-biopygen6277
MHPERSEEGRSSLQRASAKGSGLSLAQAQLQEDAVHLSDQPPPVSMTTIRSEPQQKTVSLFASNYR